MLPTCWLIILGVATLWRMKIIVLLIGIGGTVN
jgi:hypothetical protein